jgi:hypothetical protein
VVESHATVSARTAQAALRELLEAGEPVLVYLDMGFLPYFERCSSTGAAAPAGGSSVTCTPASSPRPRRSPASPA